MTDTLRLDMDLDFLMDSGQECDQDVRWVASQSTNPALQALMKEAEREKQLRARDHSAWTGSLCPTPSSASLSAWHSATHTDASFLLPLSGNSSSPELSAERRGKPLSAPQRLALSTSSTKLPPATSPSSSSSSSQPLRNNERPRSSSHSTAPPPTYIPQEEEPEALNFIELLKDVSRQLNANAQKKQRLVARERKRERVQEHSLRSVSDRDNKHVSARPLIKTSSASAIPSAGSSTRAAESSSDTFKHGHKGRALAKTASLGSSGVDLVSGKSASASLPNLNLNNNQKRTPAKTFIAPNIHFAAARKHSFPEPTSDDGDYVMQDVLDLTETDAELDRHRPHRPSLASMYMQVDDDDDLCDDSGMDISFYQPESPSQAYVAAPPKSKPQPLPLQPASHPPAPTQSTRIGPPLLGMRRAPQLQPSQYSSTQGQGSKGSTVPRFKPPLLTNGGGTTSNKSESGTGNRGTKSNGTKQPPRGGAAKVTVAKTAVQQGQDADSSFDVSFDVDPDKLEETMKAYDRL